MENEKYFSIDGVPSILIGEKSERLFIFIHGKCGSKSEARQFAEPACPKGYQVLGVDLPEHGGRADGSKLTPWDVIPELRHVMEYAKSGWAEISVRATSIGAWFAMQAFGGEKLEKCLFVSPLLDMPLLTENMMRRADVTEERLRREGEIPTDFGETLSWRYLCFARDNPIEKWNAETYILYAENDNLTSGETVRGFAAKHGCRLRLMKGGEHWFHTSEQLSFMNKWTAEIL